jgi:hypothetical protein
MHTLCLGKRAFQGPARSKNDKILVAFGEAVGKEPGQ